MEPLTPSDVKRWDLGAIHSVFETASGRAATLQRLGDNLQQVHDVLADWQGEAGDAFRVDVGKVRRDIEADGAESKQVAGAVSRAEADVRACKTELDDIQRAADANGWTITPDWRIDVGNTGIGLDPISFAAEQQALQEALNACKVHAHSADHELATAIRGSVGDIPLDATGGGPPAHGQPNPAPAGKPKTWQDMLLPTGAGDGDPARLPQSAENALTPAGAGGSAGKPPSLEDLLMGRGQPSGPGGQQPGSLSDMLSRLAPPGAAGAPAPQLKPAEVESFKAMARKTMADAGMPPDQIEAHLDEYVANAQQWMADGGPHYVPAEPPSPPPPGFGDGFADRWFATEQQIKNLTGQEGISALGDSWGGMAKGLAGKAEEFATQGPVVAGINDLTSEVKNFLDSPSPAYYAGEKAADGAVALPGLMFGGEGAAAGELGELDAAAAYDGLKPLPHSPIGLDNPADYHSWAPSAAQDLYSAFMHGEPTAGLTRQLADMSTHYFGDNPDRVVLGKWDGQDGGYIGEARGHGGIYFDTGDPTWDAMTYGLDKTQEQSLVWPVNEQFLRTRMEDHVGRIEYILDREKYSSLEDMMLGRAGSYSAMEVEFLSKNAAAYGYERLGDAWVYTGGG
jgi:hypothetical protein